jgi:hypothetical protein
VSTVTVVVIILFVLLPVVMRLSVSLHRKHMKQG